jgi:hypothetical protein
MSRRMCGNPFDRWNAMAIGKQTISKIYVCTAQRFGVKVHK